MAKKPVQTEKLPFLKGRVYDLTLFVVSLIIVLVLAVQVPFSADSYDDRVGVLLFSVYGIVGVVSVLMIRRGMILALKRPKPTHSTAILSIVGSFFGFLFRQSLLRFCRGLYRVPLTQRTSIQLVRWRLYYYFHG